MGAARILPRAPGLVRGAAIALLLVAVIASGAPAAKKTPPAHPIDLNTATLKELEQLPGVGPTTAKAIIEFRMRSGRFRRVNDLLVIRGISEAKLAKMRPYVTIAPLPGVSAKKPIASPPAQKTSPSAPPPPSAAPRN